MSAPLFDSAVVISPYFWNFRDDMWQTTHHVAQCLARSYPTVLVEPSVPWNVLSEHFRSFRVRQGVFGARLSSPRSGLTVFHRRSLPGGRLSIVRNHDLARNARTLRRFLKSQGWQRTLLWHSFPYWSEPIVDAVDFHMFVYHSLDHSARVDEETRLVRRADVVFSVSETLVEKHRSNNPRSFLLTNGVDLELFDATRAPGVRPADLPTSGRVIGFVGSINCHLDLELLVDVARAFPADHVVLVGRILSNETAPRGKHREALETLQGLGNVRFLGFKPTAELPDYVQAFDVCLVPFLANGFNQEADPLKFYQYTAMAKPIVTTPVLVAKRYADICYIGGTSDEFIQATRAALGEGHDETRRRARLAVAQAQGWPAVIGRAGEVLARVRRDRTDGAATSPSSKR